MDVDYEEIAYKIVHMCARIREDETVTIMGREDNLFYCELIALACSKLGALPHVAVRSDTYALRRATETSLEYLRKTPRHIKALIQNSDVIITVSFLFKDPALSSRIPEERYSAERSGNKPIKDIIFDGHRRWVGTDFPTPEQAASYGVDFEYYHDTFWQAMNVDYPALASRAEDLAVVLRGAKVVRIFSPKGTNLSLSIEGRRINKDDGVIDEEDVKRGDPYLNLPSGEVCMAPLETSANGKVVFDIGFWQGQKIKDLEVEFKDGRVTPLGAREGLDIFVKVLETSEGDKDRIGELGIGLNPAVKEAIGDTLLDEKIIGTIHLAIGENRNEGGINNSTLHWDLLVEKATVEVDGRVIMREGKFSLDIV
ncbi:aminopeptidase [Candidatus Hakubella thermalkaliphila]|uniref:Aminopeptidase n=1 Tax=Candidatus Hakubella thermalkaliphila TaxID=2754717 RepID=A0A6V8P9Z6_9ACTN|nr:aminopeptidase [Candidatus Hakubella thermalkaliphila]MBT9170043.1 Aminopeptidase T [Actinomycetota bacterium]GFP29153.1 aminopeptidase [Candidatus Hakubella thermalkaliphila]GFP31859.1 aminopeptidase [Candidatus Hakubella thermalkaliphila]GFP38448.1 aminopeptidase [Candidatus Hakubella thermalkaliphila]